MQLDFVTPTIEISVDTLVRLPHPTLTAPTSLQDLEVFLRGGDDNDS